MLSQVSITLSMRFLVSVRLLSLLLVVVIANVLVHLLLVSLVHPMCKNGVLLFLDVRRNNILGVKCALPLDRQLVCSYVLAFTLSRHLKVGHSIGTCGITRGATSVRRDGSASRTRRIGVRRVELCITGPNDSSTAGLDCCSTHLSFLSFRGSVLSVVPTPYNYVARILK